METFKWGRHFITGLQQVDDQHRHLVGLLNKFGTVLSENTLQYEHIDSIFIELTNYSKQHFKDEELFMTPLVDHRHVTKHTAEHHNFFTEVSSLYNEFKQGKPDADNTLLNLLTHWLAYHILGSDKNMARQIAAINDSMNPEDAYLQEEKQNNASTEPLLVALDSLFQLASRRNKELAELNRTLEEKVTHRTEELLQANSYLETIALTDVLTDLPNRRCAMQQLNLFWKEAQQMNNPLSCMMIDADGFKQINDNFGHVAGDIVIKELARELQHSVRSDDIVCRLGGDEFLIICPNTTFQGALYLGELICKKIAGTEIQAGEGVWFGSISVGVAEYSTDMQSVDTLLKAADQAVYLAKSDGKNCVRPQVQ